MTYMLMPTMKIKNNRKKAINVTTGTIVRVIALVLALVNQGLVAIGYSPIPVDDVQLEAIISTVLTVVVACWTAWKNNSFTAGAQAADKVKDAIKDGILAPEEIDELIAATRAQAE